MKNTSDHLSSPLTMHARRVVDWIDARTGAKAIVHHIVNRAYPGRCTRRIRPGVGAAVHFPPADGDGDCTRGLLHSDGILHQYPGAPRGCGLIEFAHEIP